MIIYENECVACGLPCLGSSCTYRNVPHYICDQCGEEIEGSVYEYYNEHYHEYCLREYLLNDNNLTEEDIQEIEEDIKKSKIRR